MDLIAVIDNDPLLRQGRHRTVCKPPLPFIVRKATQYDDDSEAKSGGERGRCGREITSARARTRTIVPHHMQLILRHEMSLATMFYSEKIYVRVRPFDAGEIYKRMRANVWWMVHSIFLYFRRQVPSTRPPCRRFT